MSKCYDYTSLNCLQGCEQEWQYRYAQDLASPRVDASQRFGQAVHAGVRALFDGQPAAGYTDDKTACDAVSVAWADGHQDEKKKYLTLAYAQEVVKMYAAVHCLLPGGPSSEVNAIRASNFELVLNEHYLEWPERRLCGIVDRVVRAKSDGQLYVMDLKTTGLYLSQAWFEQWRHSLQAAIYLDLVEHYYNEHVVTPYMQVAGFWADAIHVDRRGYPKPEDFMRVGPFPYSESLRSELRAVVAKLVRQADATVETGVATKNTRNCYRFNALCSFFRYCTEASEDRLDVVQMALAAGELVREEWVPALRGR